MGWKNQTVVSFPPICLSGGCTNVYFGFPQKVPLLANLSIRLEKEVF